MYNQEDQMLLSIHIMQSHQQNKSQLSKSITGQLCILHVLVTTMLL